MIITIRNIVTLFPSIMWMMQLYIKLGQDFCTPVRVGNSVHTPVPNDFFDVKRFLQLLLALYFIEKQSEPGLKLRFNHNFHQLCCKAGHILIIRQIKEGNDLQCVPQVLISLTRYTQQVGWKKASLLNGRIRELVLNGRICRKLEALIQSNFSEYGI